MIKKVGGFAVLFLIVSGSAICRAEIVQCLSQESADADPSNITRVTVELKHSVGAPFSMMTATAKSTGRRINEETPVRRIQKGEYLYYREMVALDGFELAIKTRRVAGDGLDAVLTIDPGQIYGQKVSGLKCTIAGVPNPPVAPCLDHKDLSAALIYASKYANADRIQELLECGANVNFRDEHGCAPLSYVTNLACGYDPRSTNEAPMLSSRDSLEINSLINVLLEYGAQVDVREKATNQTPLISLVKYGQLSAAELLLELEADVDAKDTNDDTSLIWAASRGDEIMVRTLLNYNPDMSWKDKAGNTAYSVALKRGYIELLELLAPIAASLTVEGQANGSCTPLSLKLKKGERTRITLKAPAGKMFRMESPILGVDLMAMSGDKAQKIVTPVIAGTFAFTCGQHGAPADQQSKGTITVAEGN